MSEESKLITFRPETDFPVTKRQKARCRCSEVGSSYPSSSAVPAVWIDEAMRDCECRACGARLSAFDYLWMVATEGGHLIDDITRLKEQLGSFKAERSLLEEEIKQLKADRRKLKQGKEPAAECDRDKTIQIGAFPALVP